MNDFLLLARHSFREQLRSRFFLVTLIFGGLLVYMSLLLGVLAADQELRVLLDFGLAAIELLTTAAVAFAAASALLREMETKTLYLILSRPVPRTAYIAGGWAGLVASAFCAVLLMGGLHVALMTSKGWHWENAYAVALLGILLKTSLTASLASLLSLVSTSTVSGLLMTAVAWTLGHFTSEMRGLLARDALRAKTMGALVYLVPDLERLNFRDRLGGAPEPLFWACLYAALYSAVCLGLTTALFRRREF
ncbi:MAG: ABC transporter permease subunit [Elusimicrobiota bacterium]